MWWKNLGLPLQSLIFGAAVALAAWLLSPYRAGDQRSHVPPRHGAAAAIGARDHSGDEPDGLFGRRPGRNSNGGSGLPDAGR